MPIIETSAPAPASLLVAAATRPRNLSVLAVAAAVALTGAVAVGLLTALAALALGALLFATLIARDLSNADFGRRVFGPLRMPLRPRVKPEQLEAIELSAAYVDVLKAHEDLRAALQDGNDDPGTGLREVYGRCTELVQATGLVARSGDSLRRYLGSKTPLAVEAEVSRLDGLAGQARDACVADAYRLAAGARRRQLHTYHQIGSLYDRIEARLTLVTSFLAAVEAMVVKLQALDLDKLHDEITAIAEQVDELNGEIGLLATDLESGRLIDRPQLHSLSA